MSTPRRTIFSMASVVQGVSSASCSADMYVRCVSFMQDVGRTGDGAGNNPRPVSDTRVTGMEPASCRVPCLRLFLFFASLRVMGW